MGTCILQVKADQGIVSTDAAPEQSEGYEMEVGRMLKVRFVAQGKVVCHSQLVQIPHGNEEHERVESWR